MDVKKDLTDKYKMTSRIFYIVGFWVLLIGFVVFVWLLVVHGFILAIGFLFVIPIGSINMFLGQNFSCNLNTDRIEYPLRCIDYVFKKNPHEVIRFDDIERIKKITPKARIRTTVLVKVYTQDGKIHHLGNSELLSTFLYAISEKNLKSLVEEEKRDLSRLESFALKLKGGKIIER